MERNASRDAVKSEPGVMNDSLSASAGKRDHLRALLDRARESRGAQRPTTAANASPVSTTAAATTAVASPQVKRELSPASDSERVASSRTKSTSEATSTARVVRLNGSRDGRHPEPPAFLPTPRGNTKQPQPEAASPYKATTSSPIPSQGGLLPTPTAPLAHKQPFVAHSHGGEHQRFSRVPHAPPPAAVPTMVHMPPPSFATPSYGHHHPHHAIPAHVASDGQVVYTAAPPPHHAPTCSCSHGYTVVPNHIPESYDARWNHYQASAPPSLTIPPQYHHAPPHPHHQDDHRAIVGHYEHSGAVAQAVASQLDRALAASISPTMSSTTSSTDASMSSSSKTGAPSRGDRKRMPSSSNHSSVRMKKPAGKSRANESNVEMSNRSVSPSLDEYEDHELHSEFVHTVHMLIPADSFGCLVGPRGDIMKQINATSGCTLSVRDASSFPFVEFDRVLRVYGKPKGICLAQRLVIERIRKYREQKNDTSYMSLTEDPLVPLGENFVTKSIQDAVASNADGEDESEEDAIAESGQLRWLIHVDNVGKIMGSEGRILKGIARDTNTTLKVSPIREMARGSSERTVIISGAPADIKRARAVIEEKAGGRLETRGINIGKCGQYFVVPHYVAGFLIGPQGSRIKKIREDTGASIQIPSQDELPLGYRNRTLHIQGRTDQVEKACASIRRRLQSYLGSADAMASSKEDEVALQLLLPVRICSSLLDQRGRLIREINEKAGAHARFLQAQDEEHRVCVLYGDMSKVFRAQRLVLQVLAGDAIANKRSGTGGAPPRKRKRVDRVDDEEEEEEEEEEEDVIEESDDLDDSDDEVATQPHRGRLRKRRPVEESGRVVVHYSDPKSNRTPAQRRGASNLRARGQRPGGPQSRNKRRR